MQIRNPGADFQFSRSSNPVHNNALDYDLRNLTQPFSFTGRRAIFSIKNRNKTPQNSISHGTVFHSAAFESNFRRKDMERVLLFLRSLKGKNLPCCWHEAFAKMVLTISPNSASAERVFSIMKNTFGDQMDHSLIDYLALSLRRQYKKKATSVGAFQY